jgi:hydrogenase maturation protein HypF
MQLYERGIEKPYDDQSEIITKLTTALATGKIAGVKGIGGYLLLCDATNEEALQTLRSRKHRPHKPFAVLYPDIPAALGDVHINDIEIKAISSKVAPIILCGLKESIQSGICINLVAPHLDKIGIMLPYTPLLQLISNQFTKPLIATSANLSGSPIIYSDKEALDTLWDFADLIVTYNREIVTPQDDSVWQFTQGGRRIVLRRSRGMAPDFYPQKIGQTSAKIMAMGADMKSAFAMHHHDKIYISQYLGDQGDYLSQESYHKTADHLKFLLDFNPTTLLIDKHPGYYTSLKGKELSSESDIALESIQHHKAHFGAVLAENDLLSADAPVLGFIWDGTGYGDDHQIWGGEVFIYDKGEMERTLYLDYFPQILGDKMSREPRLSALSLLKGHSKSSPLLSSYFSTKEWDYYQKILSKDDNLLTSSMGRLIDGIAALMGICTFNTYEGQAAMELEALARSYCGEMNEYYSLPIRHNRIDWRIMIEEIIIDLDTAKDKAFIAMKFYVSLVKLIEQTSDIYDINELAFSGGVFQNALLTGMITENLSRIKKLYFHKEISPNDESIALGQLAIYHLQNKEAENVFNSAEHLSQLTN